MNLDITATLIFVLVTNYTPGPNNILCGSMGAIYGYRRAVPFLFGIASGFFVIMLLCATLSSLVVTHLPTVAPVLRIVGSLYILWLAVGVYRGSSKLLDRPEESAPLKFWNGVVLQFVNPKAIFFGLTVHSVFLAPLLGDRSTLLWAPLLLTLVCFSALSAWAVAGNLIRGWVKTPKRARILTAVLSAALVYTAIDLAGVHLW